MELTLCPLYKLPKLIFGAAQSKSNLNLILTLSLKGFDKTKFKIDLRQVTCLEKKNKKNKQNIGFMEKRIYRNKLIL